MASQYIHIDYNPRIWNGSRLFREYIYLYIAPLGVAGGRRYGSVKMQTILLRHVLKRYILRLAVSTSFYYVTRSVRKCLRSKFELSADQAVYIVVRDYE